MKAEGCPFCEPSPEQVFHRGQRILGLWDRFPTAPGHALLVPLRHVATWFDATPEEQLELVAAIGIAREAILNRHPADGFNLGVNVGAAAGQTVFHLHLHVIPRRLGDVSDPRGGVRHVIPDRGSYPFEALAGAGRVADAAPTGLGGLALPHERPLVRGEDDPLLPHLLAHVDIAEAVDLAVAFVLEGGVEPLEEHLRDLLDRGGRLRVLAGDYLGVTEPSALLRLRDLGEGARGSVRVRVFEARDGSFHPKAYIFHAPQGGGVAYVGSSNLTGIALRDGLEWNYRVVTSRDRAGFRAVAEAFEALFAHRQTRPLTDQWVAAYRQRRPSAPIPPVEVPAEPQPPPPEPHSVQREALEKLEATRAAGNQAGLVVLATGLGKTWLAAFDSVRSRARRVLFVAHREEILRQALSTFRRIRPEARLGLYTGEEKVPEADILFASVQTLGRIPHLRRFDRKAFDYIVVDEFHRAAAATYRRLIDYFEPDFLLGLTATPERTDGGDLLALCGENLVYRCDLSEGIRRGLLAPYHYFGVPDEVDYSNIPWRSSRFDEEALTQAVATQRRSQNALEQYRRRAGRRTLAFCCSLRHADFMAEFFRANGVRAVAVHSGPTSAPRARSLEQLESGELDVLCTVDIFNEGVDLPDVDTVMMLRPTESRILWIQQFGRGLRTAPGKERLCVIDYIGNHRTFLLKPQTLLGLGNDRRELAVALERLQAGEFELPPGCEATYDLEAVEILRALLPARPDALREWYLEFREREGTRPTATEALHEGYNPRAARPAHGSWLRFVNAMGDLAPAAQHLLADPKVGAFLDSLEITPMTKGFKMMVLLAMLNVDALPGAIGIDSLRDGFARLTRRSAALRSDVGPALDDPRALRDLLENNPVDAWTGGRGTQGVSYFTYDEGRFRTTFGVSSEGRSAFQDLVREIAEYRLGEYLSRRGGEDEETAEIACKVSHAGGRPILFLPDRAAHPEIPTGWTPVTVEAQPYEANFVKVAINVIRRPGEDRNELPGLLRTWFGPDAGRPGTNFQVAFRRNEDGYALSPLGRIAARDGKPWRAYAREEIPALFGLSFNARRWQTGFIWEGNRMFLLVTLDKQSQPKEHRYEDRFLGPDLFQWQSQNRTTQKGSVGQALRGHADRGIQVHLFVRREAKSEGRASPFLYCGELEFLSWKGEKPITVQWKLSTPVPERLRERLLVPRRQ